VRSLYNLLNQSLGYDRDHLLSVRVDPAAAGYKGAPAAALTENMRQELRLLAGVRAVTVSNTGLFSGDSGDHLSLEGSGFADPEKRASRWTEIGPDYFTTLGIPLLRGRQIDADDAARAMPVCLVNESFVRVFYPNIDPIGKHLTDEYPTTRETFEIVGIVPDSREHYPNERKNPRFYANLAHPIGAVDSVTFLLRTAGDPAAAAAAVRRTIRQIDPGLSILSLRTVNEQVDRRLITERMVAELAAFFGIVAVFLAAIGLYGVISYSIARRTSEIGIRMALGASGPSVILMVLGEVLAVVVAGLTVGLPCALAAGRLVASRLYGLTPADPTAIAVATLTILSVTLLAGYVPARRASRIDPVVSLRCEQMVAPAVSAAGPPNSRSIPHRRRSVPQVRIDGSDGGLCRRSA